MKALASKFFIFFLSTTTAMAHTPGTGDAGNFEYCEHNASPVRTYKPSNVARAEKALDEAQAELDALEKEYEKLNKCTNTCKDVVQRVFDLTISRTYHENYIEYLKGDSNYCQKVTDANVRKYNLYAVLNNWSSIETEKLKNYKKPSRMIAVDANAGKPAGGGIIVVPDAPSELGTSRPRPVEPTVTISEVKPAPTAQSCVYTTESEYKIDIQICEDAKEKGLPAKDYVKCRSCLGPVNKYGKCLQDLSRINQRFAEAEYIVEQRLEELEEAKANPESKETCTDCMQDTRSWWSKWGPMAAVGALVSIPAYFAYRQDRNSYKYYKDVIHENNNRLGYPTEPREDLSGYRLAAQLLNGTPAIVNTGLATGAFGCAGSTMYGTGAVLSGLLTGTQINGAGGINGSVLGGLSGSIGGNGTAGLGGGLSGGGGVNGTGQPSSAQIQAMLEAERQAAAESQARLQYLNEYNSYYQSRAQIEADALARINALGSVPSNNGSFNGSASGQFVFNGSGNVGGSGYGYGNSTYDPLNGSFWNNGLAVGGVSVSGQVNTYGQAGFQGQTNYNRYVQPGAGNNNNIVVPSTHTNTSGQGLPL